MSKIIPIINGNKGNTDIIESNLPTLSSQNNKNLTPILDDNKNLILEMNFQEIMKVNQLQEQLMYLQEIMILH